MMMSLVRNTVYTFVITMVCVTSLHAQSALDQLFKGVLQGDVPAVTSLLDRGLDPNTADSDGVTILMMAARLGHRDLVRALVARKANVSARSPHGDTALMFAALKGHLDIARLLIDQGAPVNQSGWQPLHYAAFEGRSDVIRLLLDKGADKDGLAPNLYSPLMLAVRGGHLEAVRELLRSDADFAIEGPNGETALGLAQGKRLTEVEALLKRAGAVK